MSGLHEAIADVRRFHGACGVPAHGRPEWPVEALIKLRLDLIDEEHGELAHAVAQRDMAAAADAIADLIYVLIGAALTFGIPLGNVWSAVQHANMAKVGEDGLVRRREDGKILKPDGWQAPDIAAIVERAKVAA